MKIYSKRTFSRVEIILKETEKDKKVALKWLMRNDYTPTERKPLHHIVLWHSTHKRPYPGGVDAGLKFVKGMSLLTAEKRVL